jgi:hypothetical protein
MDAGGAFAAYIAGNVASNLSGGWYPPQWPIRSG